MSVAQFETDACSHVVFSVSACFYILFIQLQALADSCAEMSSSKLEIVSCEVKTHLHNLQCDTSGNTRELPAAIKHHIEQMNKQNKLLL